jgi:2C-methyl-D-erythritol 2,4-cyclodiphosphate synthase
MKVRTAAALSMSDERLSIKVTTTDYLGFVGREEGIAAVAIATIFRQQ